MKTAFTLLALPLVSIGFVAHYLDMVFDAVKGIGL